MSNLAPAVAQAIEEIRCTFEGCAVKVEPDGSGGAVVVVMGVPLGCQYAQADAWFGFHITFQYPYADVYPHFTDPELAQSDGASLGSGFGTASFRGQPAIQISRRSNQLNPERDTAALKLLKGGDVDEELVMRPGRLTIPAGLYAELYRHLFPGDGDEHGAVILAGTCESNRGLRLVARELHLAKDGVDYVPGKRGYRILRAEFIQSRILRARDRRLAYLAIHNHGGTDSVGFSGPDMASHERGYPALLDIARGMPVGALVFARSAIAGDLWFPGCERATLRHAEIVGHRRQVLFPKPETKAAMVGMYDRQSRLFGDAGQRLLRRTRVGIVGLGGAGSVLAELLGRLGVGEFVLADPERAEDTNLPRLIAGRRRDAVVPSWLPRTISTPAAESQSAHGGPQHSSCKSRGAHRGGTERFPGSRRRGAFH